MRVPEKIFCNQCKKEIVNGYNKYATGVPHKIVLPTQIAGGDAVDVLDDLCWGCYGLICKDLRKVYDKWVAKR